MWPSQSSFRAPGPLRSLAPLCLQNALFGSCLLRARLFLLCLLLFLLHHQHGSYCHPYDNDSRSSAPYDPHELPQPIRFPECFPIPALSLSPSRDPHSSSHSQDWGCLNTHWYHLCSQAVPARWLRLGTESGLEKGDASCLDVDLSSQLDEVKHFLHLLCFSYHLSVYRFTFSNSKMMVTKLPFWDVKLSGKENPLKSHTHTNLRSALPALISTHRSP